MAQLRQDVPKDAATLTCYNALPTSCFYKKQNKNHFFLCQCFQHPVKLLHFSHSQLTSHPFLSHPLYVTHNGLSSHQTKPKPSRSFMPSRSFLVSSKFDRFRAFVVVFSIGEFFFSHLDSTKTQIH